MFFYFLYHLPAFLHITFYTKHLPGFGLGKALRNYSHLLRVGHMLWGQTVACAPSRYNCRMIPKLGRPCRREDTWRYLGSAVCCQPGELDSVLPQVFIPGVTAGYLLLALSFHRLVCYVLTSQCMQEVQNTKMLIFRVVKKLQRPDKVCGIP